LRDVEPPQAAWWIELMPNVWEMCSSHFGIIQFWGWKTQPQVSSASRDPEMRGISAFPQFLLEQLEHHTDPDK